MNTKTTIAVITAVAVIVLFFGFGLPFLQNEPEAVNTTPSLGTEGTTPPQADASPLLGTAEVKDSSFIILPDGLKIADIEIGTGDTVALNDMLSIHYIGKFSDGKTFDSSVERGRPIDFVLGAGQLIPGMEKGVIGMNVGGVRRIIIPPSLGYGSSGVKTPEGKTIIPPDATLVFDVQMVGASSVPPANQ